MDRQPETFGKPDDPIADYAEFCGSLRELKDQQGVSYRELAKRTHYATSTVMEAVRGNRLPTLEVTLALVRACGGSEKKQKEWEQRWLELHRRAADAAGSRFAAGEAASSLRPEQVSTPAEFVAALRALWVNSGLTYSQVERASGAQLRRSTLSDMLTGRTIPTWDTLRVFITTCAEHSSVRPDLDEWRYAAKRARAAAAEQPAHALRRIPVSDCDPYQLGVHRAYPSGEDPTLPAYVHRGPTEEAFRQALGEAQDRSGFILLVGPSGAGKTRLAYEAVRSFLPDFRLLHPVSADELSAVPPPRTIVWLDDIDQYLRASLTRAMLQALLRGPRPVIVLGTIWPDQYHSYMTLPQPGTQDAHQREREVLSLATVIDVETKLSEPELARARAAARHDSRLATALSAADHGVFQTLAAGPHLLRRWNNAPDAYAKALITAAVDARRAGVRKPLTTSWLQDAAPAYLTASQRAQAPRDWFGKALAYAATPVHGGIAVLTPISATAGISQVDGYHVADFLARHQDYYPSSRPSRAAARFDQSTTGDTGRCLGSSPRQASSSFDNPPALTWCLNATKEAGIREDIIALAAATNQALDEPVLMEIQLDAIQQTSTWRQVIASLTRDPAVRAAHVRGVDRLLFYARRHTGNREPFTPLVGRAALYDPDATAQLLNHLHKADTGQHTSEADHAAERRNQCHHGRLPKTDIRTWVWAASLADDSQFVVVLWIDHAWDTANPFGEGAPDRDGDGGVIPGE
jgi:transcriptional regulator with XRE-family HTH domain